MLRNLTKIRAPPLLVLQRKQLGVSQVGKGRYIKHLNILKVSEW